MANLLARLKARLKERKTASPAATARARARRRKLLVNKGARFLPYFQLLLAVAGFLQFLVLPLPLSSIARRAFIDENAVQPGQVNVYFNWPDVNAADRYADQVADLQGSSSAQRAAFLQTALRQAGLPAATQSYSNRLPNGTLSETGVNTYATIRAPKTSGSEAIVLAAPWKSRQDGMHNIRGVSTLLALAKHLQKLAVWSKDIILVFPDSDLGGLQAWLHTYHAYNAQGMEAEPLEMSAGSIWNAYVVDYPYHSFSHIGIYYDGVNGRLPNLDLVNSAAHIARWIGGVPVRLHNDTYEDQLGGSLSLDNWKPRYSQRARGILNQVRYGMTTQPSGPEGLFGQYGIDAVGLFGVPAEGPHGFFAIARTIESLCRASNNIIERLHASFFLYMLPEPFQFLSVASYLSAPLLIGASLTIAGLRIWNDASDGTALPALVTVALSYVFGILYYLTTLSNKPIPWWLSAVTVLSVTWDVSTKDKDQRRESTLAFTLLSAGMIVSVATILSYGLGAAISVVMGIPLLLRIYLPKNINRIVGTAFGVAPVLASGYVTVETFEPFSLNLTGAPARSVFWLVMYPLWYQSIVSSVF